MEIKIEKSPFGDEGVTYTGQLAMFNHFRLQLISYRTQDKTPEERAYLEADIAGYDEILKSGHEENAQEFMKNKRDPATYLNRFKDNLSLVNWLKANGKWK